MIVWAGWPSSRGLSYWIISNVLYTCFSGVCSKVYFGIKILIVTIRFQCEFKDQTVCYYACAIQTKAWATKIKVILWYLGLANIFNSIGLQICTSRGAYYLHNKSAFHYLASFLRFDFKDIDLRQLNLEQTAHRVLKFIKSVLVTRNSD